MNQEELAKHEAAEVTTVSDKALLYLRDVEAMTHLPSCPRCYSQHILTHDYGRKTGTIVGSPLAQPVALRRPSAAPKLVLR